jgi:hypothetical protein
MGSFKTESQRLESRGCIQARAGLDDQRCGGESRIWAWRLRVKHLDDRMRGPGNRQDDHSGSALPNTGCRTDAVTAPSSAEECVRAGA